MLVVPIRTDRRLNAIPWVNIALIVANFVLFLLTRDQLDDDTVRRWMLDPRSPRLLQFITYQFLHHDPIHLLSNMAFLYLFGNSVEDRLGKVGYLAFYLAGGVFAGLGHSLMESAPVLGASGSIAAVTGAYLALFPRSNVTLFYWFFIFGLFEISSLILILVQVIQNVVFQIIGPGKVAYVAHLAGYAYGFMVGMALLWVRFLPREPFDMMSMWEQYRRRAKFRAMTRDGFTPWAGDIGSTAAAATAPVDPRSRQIMDQRASISNAVAQRDLAGAADLYVQLLAIDGGQTLPRQQQYDVANQLMSDSRHDHAARAYELFLTAYRQDPQRDQVELILGLIYARYLGRKQRAREVLQAALPRLTDADQRQLAQQLLGETAS